jgi:sigma-B regulation protein RsbU (phosphoserine phosphatase)
MIGKSGIRGPVAQVDFQEFRYYKMRIIHQWAQTMALLGVILVPLFLILDYFAVPGALLPRFILYRGIGSGIAGIQYIILRNTKPTRLSYLHGYLFTLVIGGVIILMTADLGGFSSRYYAGINLVIIAVTLLLPLGTVNSAINGVMIVALYVVWNLIAGNPYNMSDLISNLFFMIATVVISVSINHVRNGLIKKEYYSRWQLLDARDALWTEMELAKKIQTSLLPDQRKIDNFEIACVMLPAEDVGGDYYDIIETKAGERWIAIGDVSGHGLESGLVMMMMQISFFSLVNIYQGYSPSTVLEYLNYVIRNDLRRLGSNRYMTVMAIRLDKSILTFAGNHQDILIYRTRTNTVERIPAEGSWIGLSDQIHDFLKDTSIVIEKDDLILLFTDGVTEAGGKDGEMFGQERLERLLYKYAKLPTEAVVNNIARDVIVFHEEQSDDITLMALRRLF